MKRTIPIKIFLALALLQLALTAPASAFNLGISSSIGGSNIVSNAGIEDQFEITTVLSPDLLQNKISGSGNFSESHWIKNDAGDQAGVGANVTKAKDFTYSWAVEKDETGKIKAQETLDVDNAVTIKAYSEARVSIGNKARSEINIGNGSIAGYSTEATVSADGLILSSNQKFSKAEGNVILTESQGSIGDAKSRTITDINRGAVTDYSDIVNVDNSRKKVNVEQLGHTEIDLSEGSFKSHSDFKDSSKYPRYQKDPEAKKETRTSNYGTKYDFKTVSSFKSDKKYFWSPEYEGSVSGKLEYYVDIDNPNANSIQRAIDAASKGDSINIAPGTYHRGLITRKSLNIKGSGPDKTIIDGQRDGSVIKVKDKDARLYIKGLTLTNGSAKYGGGIDTPGDLTLKDCRIVSNIAKYGGAVHHMETFVMSNSVLDGNTAVEGGAVYNDRGSFIMRSGRISNNTADYGGAICNDHAHISLEGGDISNNTANKSGGGIHYLWTFSKDIDGDESIVHDNKNGDIVYEW
jgi:hypothetical protein